MNPTLGYRGHEPYIKAMKRLICILVVGLMGCGVGPMPASADEPAVYTNWRTNAALSAYDAMSFHDGTPVKGDPQYYYSYQGAMFYFSSQKNRNRFISEPERFAPAYGGYCAWAVSHGKLAPGDPEYWTVKDGRLYLNFNRRVQRRWLKRADRYIARADAKWPEILED
ncbi:YHS domain-containing (seleno)protein [Robiginitomaculum antarcticum]|uniref:YHS domain-containing (seleno)protein n=1 Tax=Robiginitomaculum antarcticum TaxID=437507 RepID=UPI000360AB01|nr:YHS domain-containing (seleno)protein [Robiginitomaculum antarcticum]